jgi:cell division septal protein FtsQ
MGNMKEQTTLNPIKERRRRAARAFAWRVGLLLFLLGGVAYAAWLAPWARPARNVELTVGR